MLSLSLQPRNQISLAIHLAILTTMFTTQHIAGLVHLPPAQDSIGGLYEIENTIADPTPQERLLNDISQATLEFLNEDISDFEDDGDLSDSDNDAGTCSSY